MSIADNVKAVRAQMAEAALRAGRDPSEIALCAATKMNDAARVREAVAAGVDACGENRVQELLEKLPQGAYTGRPVHFIGHLQKNKAKQVVGAVDLIESVDSVELLTLLNRLAAERGIVQDILLEVNIGGEAAKSGVAPEQVDELAAQMADFSALRLRGLMAIPPVSEKTGGNLQYFEKMHQLFVDIRAKKYDNSVIECLSMGMSGDFADAIAAGSTMVRIGTAIFGARQYPRA
jgi:hypothetical protein